MLLVHLDVAAAATRTTSSSSSSFRAAGSAKAVLQWVDRVQRYLNNSTLFKETVLLVLVLTPPPGAAALTALGTAAAATCTASTAGTAGDGGGDSHQDMEECKQGLQRLYKGAEDSQITGPRGWLAPGVGDGASGTAGVQRPVQSWQQLCGRVLSVDAVDVSRPMLCCRRLPGVVRRDGCNRLTLVEGYCKGGMGPLVCDRLLPELAYKLGRAHKYGA